MENQHTVDKEFETRPKSKSQIKREFHEFQALGKQLVALSHKQLEKLPLSDRLRDAIELAKSLKHGALSRQFKYLGNLISDEDAISIRLMLNKFQQPHKEKTKVFHEVEQWRDRLLQGDLKLLEELANRFKNLERQHINQLIRNAKKEQQLNKTPKSARLLFKHLVELQKNE